MNVLNLVNVLEEMRCPTPSGRLRLDLCELSNHMESMAGEMRADFLAGNWSADFIPCLTAQLECYQELAEVLGQLSQADRFVEDDLELVWELAQELRQLADAVSKAFRCDRPRCSNCGAACGDYCHSCGLTPLIWDVVPDEYEEMPSGGSASLQQVYWQIVALLEGGCRLHEVEQAMDQARREPGLVQGMVSKSFEQLAIGLRSRRTSHILAGWAMLCRAMHEADQPLLPLAC